MPGHRWRRRGGRLLCLSCGAAGQVDTTWATLVGDCPEGDGADPPILVPGLLVSSAVISPQVRVVKGDVAAVDDALTRMRGLLIRSVGSLAVERGASSWVVATIDHRGRLILP